MKFNWRYFKSKFIAAAVVMPIMLQLLSLLVPISSSNTIYETVLTVIGMILISFVLWWRNIKAEELPERAFERYLPLTAAFIWYLLSFIVIFGLAGYDLNGISFCFLPALPWSLLLFNLLYHGDTALFPVVIISIYTISIMMLAARCRNLKIKSTARRSLIPLLSLMLVVFCICGIQFYNRSQRYLPKDYSVVTISDEVKLWQYQPYRKGNLLQVPRQPVSLTIKPNYPTLDGATAAYPVYAAMAQAVYEGLTEYNADAYVKCSKTGRAYERLIAGEVDIFFGAEPSRQQQLAAQEAGVELKLIPIAKEAFVFFVNRENPINDLSIEQIQDIYTKQITNWQDVGGENLKITPFQRPKNSGSQTIMLKMMGERKLPKPLMEESAADMGGIISAVADYRNLNSAIGYSFRFFATEMKQEGGIKLLKINGIEPIPENIRDGSYPFTVDVYAVVTKEPEGNSKLLLDWILSEEGQDFIEQCGYVRK